MFEYIHIPKSKAYWLKIYESQRYIRFWVFKLFWTNSDIFAYINFNITNIL